MPHAHGDHFQVGPAAVSVRDTIGLGNPNLNPLARKGLPLAGRTGLPALTAEGLAYGTGIAAEILHGVEQYSWARPSARGPQLRKRPRA